MSKKQDFDALFHSDPLNRTLFRPILMHFAARYIGATYAQFASDYRTLVRANIECMDAFQTDMVGLISDPYRETSAFGARITFLDEAVPKCEDILIRSKDDIKALANPDVYKAERTRDRIHGAELFQKQLKGGVPIIGWIEGPLAEACDLAGVSEVLMQLMMDPDFVCMLMDKCLMTARAFAKAQIEAGCDVIGIGDAICSQIDQATYDQFVRDRHAELVRFIQDQGARVKLHICGDITHLLPSIKTVAPDICDLDWQVDPDHAAEMLGPDIARCGNINPVSIQNESPQTLYVKARDLIKKEENRAFILSGGCEISVNTPHEHVSALSNACTSGAV
ncbi:MAG: uroporphyrinogen decarboxylase family protein [candidate division KSB1 bacterium]|nr:uroporphyrinogen decarboxylase family protein [candidate division KSB1 bacterium]